MRRVLSALLTACILGFATQAAATVTVVPYFDTSITGASNAAVIESTITSALKFYSNFSNNVTVRILYAQYNTTSATAFNYSGTYFDQYSDYAGGLLPSDAASHPENHVLNNAIAFLASGNVPPVTSPVTASGFVLPADQYLLLNSANLRALGYGEDPDSGTPGFFRADGHNNLDGIVYLSSGIDPYDGSPLLAYSPTFPDSEGDTDATSAILHETDEVLGIGGGGSTLSDQQADGLPGVLGALDLYRYSGPGQPSFTTDPTASAYFSVDGGATDINDFNQQYGADYGDWVTTCNPRQVQDAYACYSNAQFGLTRNAPEVTELQAIGYNLAPVPEPATWAMLLTGMLCVGSVLRSRRGVYAHLP